MSASLPTPEKLTSIALSMGIQFAEGDAGSFISQMSSFFAAADHTLQAVDPLPEV